LKIVRPFRVARSCSHAHCVDIPMFKFVREHSFSPILESSYYLPLIPPPIHYDYIAMDVTTVPTNNTTTPHAPLGSEKATNHIQRVHHVRIHRKPCHEPVIFYRHSSQYYYFHSHLTHLQPPATLHITSSSFQLQ
jgi:hypothetical protein